MPRITGQSGNNEEGAGTATKARAPAKPRAQPRTKSKRNEKAAREMFDALAARDLERLASYWDDETIEDIVPVGIYRGREEIRGFFRELLTAFPDFEITVDRVVADAGTAAVGWRATGTFTGGPFLDIEPNGKRVEMRGCDLMEIEEGKLRRNTVFYDGAGFARDLGLLPPRESGAERAMFSAFNTVTKVRAAVRERRARE
jgi:steroid delta-isomerase-like uncharacterized protein